MPTPFALTCDSCREPMLPNLSQADADGCLRICINPDCPELCAGELETEDLVEGGGAAAPPLAGSREQAQTDLASLCGAARHAAADAEERLAGIDSEPPGVTFT